MDGNAKKTANSGLTDEQAFLQAYDASAFKRPSVAVDVVLLSVADDGLRVLLVKRTEHPAKNRWSLPGGFVGMDESLEEAAMDLGCGPLRVLFDITLPLIAPAMLAGWLLAFTLSLDDLVIASFVSGPGATTLPITKPRLRTRSARSSGSSIRPGPTSPQAWSPSSGPKIKTPRRSRRATFSRVADARHIC